MSATVRSAPKSTAAPVDPFADLVAPSVDTPVAQLTELLYLPTRELQTAVATDMVVKRISAAANPFAPSRASSAVPDIMDMLSAAPALPAYMSEDPFKGLSGRSFADRATGSSKPLGFFDWDPSMVKAEPNPFDAEPMPIGKK